MLLFTFLMLNNQIITKAKQEYEESPLNTKEAYDNFMISLLNEDVTKAINEQYGESFVGFKRTSENFIKIQELTKEDEKYENRRHIKYIVTFSLSPIVEERGKQVTKGTDVIQFEVLTDHLSQGDANKGIKLIKYQQHK
jgi:Protein of unknown function (DUF3888)